MRRIIGAIAVLTTSLLFLALPASAEGIASKGHASAGVQVADGPAIKTGWWIGGDLKTMDTSFEGTMNDYVVGFSGGYDYIFPGTGLLLGARIGVDAPMGSLHDIAGVNYSWYGNLRFGALLSDRLLGYGFAGLRYNEGAISEWSSFFDASTREFGAGVELAFAKTGAITWTTGLEWTHSITGSAIPDAVATQDTIGTFLRLRF